MDLKELTREVFLFAAMLRDRLDNDPGMTAASLMHEAKNHFAAMDQEASRHKALEVRYQQIRFGLVALLDDMIVASSWSQASQWPLLEMQYYGTNIAGDRIYELIPAFSAADADLIELFFFVLALGFRGKHVLDEAKWQSTLSGMYQSLPNKPHMQGLKLSPEAYNVIRRKSMRLDPLFSLWRSVAIFLVCLVMLFVFYKVAWNDVVRKAEAKSQDVIQHLNNDELRRSLQEGGTP